MSRTCQVSRAMMTAYYDDITTHRITLAYAASEQEGAYARIDTHGGLHN